MQVRPSVSIITPVYNAAETLEECVHSVIAQGYEHWEMILVDDCSTDSSAELMKALSAKDPRVKSVFLETNVGAAAARNKAIEMANGRFIAFLDSDDLWLPQKLERQVEFALESEVAITHTAYEWVDAVGSPTGKVIQAPRELGYRQMLNYNHIGCLTGMYDTAITGKKYFMPSIEKRQDYALWLSILRDGHKALFLDEVLAQYRTGRKSLSSNKWSAATYNFKLLREVEGLSWFKAGIHFTAYLFLAARKYLS